MYLNIIVQVNDLLRNGKVLKEETKHFLLAKLTKFYYQN